MAPLKLPLLLLLFPFTLNYCQGLGTLLYSRLVGLSFSAFLLSLPGTLTTTSYSS